MSSNQNSKVDAHRNKHLAHTAHDKDDNERKREIEIDNNISTQQVCHCCNHKRRGHQCSHQMLDQKEC